MDECECTGVGWCERHRMHKSANMVRLCKLRKSHWEAWERGDGIGQVLLGKIEPRPLDKEVASVAAGGWGDKVTTALKAIGVTEDRYKAIKEKFGLPPTCGCAQRREWLNKVGRWWNGEEE